MNNGVHRLALYVSSRRITNGLECEERRHDDPADINPYEIVFSYAFAESNRPPSERNINYDLERRLTENLYRTFSLELHALRRKIVDLNKILNVIEISLVE